MNSWLSDGKTVLVNFYNPGAANRYPIRLRVTSKEVDIISSNNTKILGDILCSNYSN